MEIPTSTSDHEIVIYIITGAVAGLVAIVWYLLREKDRKQGELIANLYTMHEKDAKELYDLKIQIAENHYRKGELDTRFDRLEDSNREEFARLNSKMDMILSNLIGTPYGGG